MARGTEEAFRQIEQSLADAIRADQAERINRDPGDREILEKRYGKVWDTEELRAEFEVLGFLAPYVIVRRRSDGQKGTLMFQHIPRYYFSWRADDDE